MKNMRREHGGLSSNASKAAQKRSGGHGVEERVNAMSPYHSHEDLSAMLDQHDDGTLQVVEDLDSKVAATREEARKTIMIHLSRNVVDLALEQHASSIMLKGCQWLTNSRSNDSQKRDGVELACGVMLCCADAHVSMYDELGMSLYTWLAHPASCKNAASLLCGVLRTISLLLAANPQCTAGDRSLHDALQQDVEWSRFEKDPEAYGEVLSTVASTCSVTCRSKVKGLIDKAVHAPRNEGANALLLGAVRAMGILNDKFKGTYVPEDVESLTAIAVAGGADKTVITALRILQSAVEGSTPAASTGTSPPASAVGGVSPVASGSEDLPILPPPSSPSRAGRSGPCETIQFRERTVVLDGYQLVYLLDCLRDVVGEGLLSHIAHNTTVRRMFGIRGDLVTKLTKEELALEREDLKARKAEKESSLRERAKDRHRKHRELQGHAGGADADECDDGV